jgi:dihydroorotase
VLPPLAGKKDVEALWESVRDGTVDIIGSDHAPHTSVEKKGENPPAGFPGLETAFPLMLNAWKNGLLTLKTLLRLTSGAAGGLFKISDRTCIKPGLRADFSVFREGEFIIGEEGYETKSGWSPFHGVLAVYKPFMTVIRGFTAFDSGIFYMNPVKTAQIS